MAKKKWYVVIVGKAVGIFETWLEAAPLISGVSGALYQSFSSEEEAIRVFEDERDKGNTRVVGGQSSISRSSHSASPVFSVNPPSVMSTPLRSPLREELTSSWTSPPRMPSTPQTRRQLPLHRVTPTRSRSRSPTVVHSNVSYSRGPLSPSRTRASPGHSEHTNIRVQVETPTGFASYPSDDDTESMSTRSSSYGTNFLGKKRQTSQSFIVFDEARSPRNFNHVDVGTPSGLASYPSGSESNYTSTPAGSGQNGRLLSPLNSPKLGTPKDNPLNTLGGRSSKQPSQSSRHSRTPSTRSPARLPHPVFDYQDYSHQTGNVPSQTVVYVVAHCPHTCPHCKEAITSTTGNMASSQRTPPIHEHPDIHDPRSPLRKQNTVHVDQSSILFGRPSPRVKLEEQMNNLVL